MDDFLESVRRVENGGTATDPEVVAQLFGRRCAPDLLEELTPREREVLGLMAEGFSTWASARSLFLSLGKTVETTCTRPRARLPPAADDHRRVLAVLAFCVSPDASSPRAREGGGRLCSPSRAAAGDNCLALASTWSMSFVAFPRPAEELLEDEGDVGHEVDRVVPDDHDPWPLMLRHVLARPALELYLSRGRGRYAIAHIVATKDGAVATAAV